MKKIIDEKGRLFGKVNLIDLLVVLLVVAVVAAVVFKVGGGEVTKQEQLANSEMQDISYTVLCRMVHNDVADYIEANEVGSQLMSNGELVESCYITDIQRDNFYENYITPEGEPAKLASEEYCDLTITVSGQAPYAENSFHVGSQEVRVGKSHIVKTVGFEITGTVVELEGANG